MSDAPEFASPSYRPISAGRGPCHCCCATSATEAQPCWGKVEVIWDESGDDAWSSDVCEGHRWVILGEPYEPEPGVGS